MAIFKVIVKPDGTSVGHATPEKLEDYLKTKEDERGEKIPRDAKIGAINADAENFSEDCFAYSIRHNTCLGYDDLKHKHYVQGFPPEDCDKMTREKCHELGMEAARTLWKDFPVLVVTHYDQEVEGTGEYHWHNHFLVYNCNIKNGHKINTKGSELWAQKRFIAAQAEANGLTRKGLILENGRIRESQQEVKYTMSERQIAKRGMAASSGKAFITQKVDLRFAIIAAMTKAENYEGFCKILDKEYHIKTKESRGSIGFLHPQRRGQERAWIRGKALGEAFTKEAIINGISQDGRQRHIGDTNEKEQFKYYSDLIERIYSNNTPDGGEREQKLIERLGAAAAAADRREREEYTDRATEAKLGGDTAATPVVKKTGQIPGQGTVGAGTPGTNGEGSVKL